MSKKKERKWSDQIEWSFDLLYRLEKGRCHGRLPIMVAPFTVISNKEMAVM